MQHQEIRSTCDRASEIILLALVSWLALAYGGVLPISHIFVTFFGGVLGLILAVRSTLGRGELMWSWSFAPALGYVALAGLHLVELPTSVLRVLAPPNAAAWEAQLAAPPLAEGLPTSLPLTLWPDGTAYNFPLLLASALILVTACQLYRDPVRVQRLCLTVACLAGLLGLGWILENVFDVPTPTAELGPHAPLLGPVVSYSFFAEFANLGLGCAFALLLLRYGDRSGRTEHHVPRYLSDLRRSGRMQDRLLLALALLLAIAIAVSQSRMGVFSTCVAGGLFAWLLERSRAMRGTGWLLGMLVVATLLVLLFFGFDRIYNRIATIADPAEGLTGRAALFRDTLTMFANYPILGSGQGSYEYAFPMFDESMRGGRAQHAENVYVEHLAETGLVGAALQLAFVALVGTAWLRRIWRPKQPSDMAAIGLLFGLTAVLVHGMTDFGVRIALNGITCLLCIAAAIAPACRPCPATLGRVFGGGLGAVAAVALWWSVPSYWHAHVADTMWRECKSLDARVVAVQGRLAQAAPEARSGLLDAERDLYARQVELIGAAARRRPGHPAYILREANVIWDQAYAEQTRGLPESELSDDARAQLVAAAERAQQIALQGRRHAPTYGLLWSVAGMLGWRWIDQPESGEWLFRGVDMSPETPWASIEAGEYLLALSRQAEDEEVKLDLDLRAAAAFTHAATVGAKAPPLINAILSNADRPDLAAFVMFDNAYFLVQLRRRLHDRPEWADVAADVRLRLLELIEPMASKKRPAPFVLQELATLKREDGDLDAAIALLKRVLVYQPDSGARLSLAELLEEQGNKAAAVAELRRLLVHQPRHTKAKEMLERLQPRSGR